MVIAENLLFLVNKNKQPSFGLPVIFRNTSLGKGTSREKPKLMLLLPTYKFVRGQRLPLPHRAETTVSSDNPPRGFHNSDKTFDCAKTNLQKLLSLFT